MKLYTFDAAPNPARLKLFIDYKGINIETIQIDLSSGEQLGDAYRSIVPEATVPALLLLDGTILCAVIAIVNYLELTFPDRPLLGESPEEKATILNWSHRLFTEVLRPIADVFRNTHPKYVGRALPGPVDVAQIPALATRGKNYLLESFKMLDSELATRTFIAGNAFSFADIDLIAAIDFAKWGARMKPDASLENLYRWEKQARNILAS